MPVPDPVRHELESYARSTQHGAIARSQALAAGVTEAQIKRRLRRRQWVPLGPQGWYVVADRLEERRARLVAGTRSLDGPAWGASALALFNLNEHPETAMVASCRRYSGRGVSRIHVERLPELPRTRIEGIDTVTAAVAVVAAGRWAPTELDLHLLIDRAIREGLTTWRKVEDVLELFPRRGRAGSTKMRQVLDSHGLDEALPLSDWGRRFVVSLVDAGLPRARMEYRVVDRSGRLVAQVDAAYPAELYAIELDSHAYHLNPEAFERDRQRDGTLAQHGWLVRRFTWRQWQRQRSWVLATIRADLSTRQPQAPRTTRSPRRLAG